MLLRRSLKTLVLAGLLGSASVLAADAPKATGAPVPLLWKVSDKDNAVYLLGSFHLLRTSDYPLSAAVDAAFADAERLLFELSPEEMQSPALPQLMMQAAMRTDGKTLQQDLDAATWTRLDAWAGKNGVPLATFNGFEPWFVGLFDDASGNPLGGLVRMDPATGAVDQFASIGPADPNPSVVASGAIWVPDEAGHRVLRVNVADLSR